MHNNREQINVQNRHAHKYCRMIYARLQDREKDNQGIIINTALHALRLECDTSEWLRRGFVSFLYAYNEKIISLRVGPTNICLIWFIN